ncbi:MAG: hypothetical protein ACREQH_15435 [Candidatus Binatus sp.]
MKSKLNLMTALIGLAMLATPLTAAAKDHGRFAQGHSHAARVERSFRAPARNFGPVVVNRHDFRKGRAAMWMPAPAVVARHEWRGDGDADDYQNYGNPGYVAAPAYSAPVYAVPAYSGYGAGYGGGQNCRKAHRMMNVYYRDRNTGHPAAAYDLLRQHRRAFSSGCANVAPVGGGLLGGLGGYGGAPAYANYGGYNGGYAQPGYGQPYGGSSILTPLLQQFVR